MTTLPQSLLLAVMATLAAPACGGSSGPAGAAGSAGIAGTGGTDASNETDFTRLEACAAPEPCLGSLAQLIEAYTRYIGVERLGCVLEALRDRKPGKYPHETDSTFGNGSVGANHLLLVASDGSVAYARERYDSFNDPPAEPGKRCQLKPPAYFEECLQALASPQGDPAWACAFGDGGVRTSSSLFWFESCTDESPHTCD